LVRANGQHLGRVEALDEATAIEEVIMQFEAGQSASHLR
jgi:hypothetical protein